MKTVLLFFLETWFHFLNMLISGITHYSLQLKLLFSFLLIFSFFPTPLISIFYIHHFYIGSSPVGENVDWLYFLFIQSNDVINMDIQVFLSYIDRILGITVVGFF